MRQHFCRFAPTAGTSEGSRVTRWKLIAMDIVSQYGYWLAAARPNNLETCQYLGVMVTRSSHDM